MKTWMQIVVTSLLAGCAATRPPASGNEPWEARLTGDRIVLLGEVHDNAEQHRLRVEALRRALGQGWRPAIAMEQFDIDRQADIDRARRESPRDAAHLIAEAVPDRSGWDWSFYKPVVELALKYDLPLIAANLPNPSTSRIVREGTNQVFDAERRDALGLDRPIDTAWQSAQQAEIASGHCGMLPDRMLPSMAAAQFARDAVMADTLRHHADHGVVLLAGNGHVRKDLGVPRWLTHIPKDRILAIGYLERPIDPTAATTRFDAIVSTPPIDRPDPCAAFTKPSPIPNK